MMLLAMAAFLPFTTGNRMAQEPETLDVAGKFKSKQFPVSDTDWSLTPLDEFQAEGSTEGMAGGEFVANGNPVTLEVVHSNRLFFMTEKHAHYVILEDGKAVAWMRSKFNAVSGYDWDLLPGGATLTKGWGSNKSPEVKKLRRAKGKGIIFPMNPKYFAKSYIKGPDAGKKADDVYYTITHLNPISKHMKNLGKSHVRVSRGWCGGSGSNKNCETVAAIVCTFYHQSCVIKTNFKDGEEIGSIVRTKKGIGSGGDWKVTATKGDVLLFAQVAGFIDMADDWKRMKTLGPAKIPVNIVERVR